MQQHSMPPLHWFFRLILALVLLGLVFAFLALLGVGLLSWSFYHAGQVHRRELEAERRQPGRPLVTDASPPRPSRPRPTR